MNNCEYCQQLNSKTNTIVAENDYAICYSESFFREGHCSVVLKRHVSSISELTNDEYINVFSLVKTVSKALEIKYNANKTYLLSIGDQVDHFHVHLIPKHKDKCSMGVYCFGALFEKEGKRKPTNEEKEIIKESLVIIIKDITN